MKLPLRAAVMLGLSYVVISVVAGLRSFDPAQEMVARSLGINRLRSFFAMTLPQIKASVLAGGIFAFTSAMDETIVGLFISGGQYQPLTKRMFTALRDEIDPTIANQHADDRGLIPARAGREPAAGKMEC